MCICPTVVSERISINPLKAIFGDKPAIVGLVISGSQEEQLCGIPILFPTYLRSPIQQFVPQRIQPKLRNPFLDISEVEAALFCLQNGGDVAGMFRLAA